MTDTHAEALFSVLMSDVTSRISPSPQSDNGTGNMSTVIEIAPIPMATTEDNTSKAFMCPTDDLDPSTSRSLTPADLSEDLDPTVVAEALDLDPAADPDAVGLEDVDVHAEEENYGISKIRTVMDACARDPNQKPSLSYIALLSLAIESSEKKRMLLSEIYSWISDKFPYYKSHDRSWRNSIRHNLSLNECFIKAGRSENGKGNYWSIHPANVDDFSRGDFRRRRARRCVRKCNEELERLHLGFLPSDNTASDPYFTPGCNGYVMMTSTQAPAHALIRLFGTDNILSKEERLQAGLLGQVDYQQHTGPSSCITAPTASQQSDMYTVTPAMSNLLYHSAPHAQNDSSGYCMTQYTPTSELNNPFTALTSVAEGYRHIEQTIDGCQFTTSVKGFSNLARYSPY